MKWPLASLLFFYSLATPQLQSQATAPPNFDETSAQALALLDTNPSEAATLFQSALAMQPSWSEGWFYLGGSLYALQRYTDSLDAFNKSISLSPQNGPALAFRGLCQFELKHPDAALHDIQQGEATGLGANRPFESSVRQHAALILVHAAQFDQAMAQLQPLTNYQDSSPGVIQAAGLCALAISQWPDDLTPEKRAVVNMAGEALWAGTSRQPDKANPAFQKLLATYPNEPGVHYAYGLYIMEADQDLALTEFQKEIKATPSHWPSYLVAASLETKRGTPTSALQTAQAALKIVPPNYRWLCHAESGRAFLAMEKPVDAIAEFQIASKQDPSNPQMHFYLERAYRRAGQTAAADRERAEFVRLKSQQDPDSMPQPAVEKQN